MSEPPERVTLAQLARAFNRIAIRMRFDLEGQRIILTQGDISNGTVAVAGFLTRRPVVAMEARATALGIAQALGTVGMLTVEFFLTAEAVKPNDPKEPLPEHVVIAQKHLKTLREKDPETVKAAEEFFYLNF